MTTFTRSLAVGLALTATTVLVACGGGSGAASQGAAEPAVAAQQVNLKTQALKFDPTTLTVKAAQPVQVNLENLDGLEHDFAVRGTDTAVKIAVPALGKTSGTFTVAKPGSYEFYCTVAGHEAAGMKGTLTVQ